MKRLPKFLLSAAMVATMATSFSAVMAATPPDTLVQAWQIDDIISLDPAEMFEFSASEIIGNTYERLITYDIKDVSKISGQVAESWTVSPDGKTFTFKISPNKQVRLRQPDHRRGRGLLAPPRRGRSTSPRPSSSASSA